MTGHTPPADGIASPGDRPRELERELTERFGPLIGGVHLITVAGFPTGAAFRQALHRDRVGFPVFQIPGRRGRFAWTADVARWLAQLSQAQAPSTTKTQAGEP